MAMQAPASKDWFLYLMMDDRICRLNIDEFCKKNSPKPQFEIVHDYYLDDDTDIPLPNTTLPRRMEPIVVDSQVYMLGGTTQSTTTSDPQSNGSDHEDDDDGDDDGDDDDDSCDDAEDDARAKPKRVRRQRHETDTYVPNYVPNLDVFAFDPDVLEGPTISLNDGGNIPRRIIDPRLVYPLVFTLEDKIYVMATTPYSGDEKDTDHHPPLFRVFDPLHQFWKELPRPPHCVDRRSFHEHCTWGHNLVIYTHPQTFYRFDTHQEKWEEWPKEKEDEQKKKSQFVFKAVVEFEGFIIGVKRNENGFHDRLFEELGVYQLDPSGVPKLIRALDELQGIFCPFSWVDKCVMGKCDGGRMWLVYSSSKHGVARTRVAVFQVSISDDFGGNPVFSTELQAAEFYMFHSRGSHGYLDKDLDLDSAFSMCHHANNREIEEKNLCGTIIKHDHPRG